MGTTFVIFQDLVGETSIVMRVKAAVRCEMSSGAPLTSRTYVDSWKYFAFGSPFLPLRSLPSLVRTLTKSASRFEMVESDEGTSTGCAMTEPSDSVATARRTLTKRMET